MTLLSAALLGGALSVPPQSSQFPRFLMVLQLSLARAGRSARRVRRQRAARRGVPIQVFAATAAYVITIEQLGYFVATALFLCATMFWFGRHRAHVMLAVTVDFLLAMYVLFVLLMGVRLPGGLLI